MNSKIWKTRIRPEASHASRRRDTSPLLFLLVFALACSTTDNTRRGYLRDQSQLLNVPTRPVIVIPGFGHTRLYDPVLGRFVWGTAHTMAMQTRYADDLDLPESGHDRLVPRGYVASRGPINLAWRIIDALKKYGHYTPGHDVYPFEYDWRLSSRENALRLAELVDRVRGAGKVDIVTHSAGSMIAQAYVKLGGGAVHVEHLVMIGPAQEGVVDAFRIVVRPERFIRRVLSSDMVKTWPSVYELLPEDGRILIDENGKMRDVDVWQSDERELTRKARAFRDELKATPMPESVKMTVIAGDCVPTARRVLARDDGTYAFYPHELRPREQRLARLMFEAGDGTVPVSSARGDGEALLFCDGHQGLTSDPNVQRAILRLLNGR